MSKRSYSLLEITLTGRQKHLINTTNKKKLKTRKSQKYLALRQKIFSPKNFFSWAQCEIYYTSPPIAPPSNATSKQTKLILHLQVFQLHNSSEKQTVFTIHVQRLEVYSRWPDLGPAPPTIVVYLK